MSNMFFAFFVFIFVVSCQHKPTKVIGQDVVLGGGQLGDERLTAENIIKDKPLILDVRPAFEFNLSYVPGAVNVRWEDFSQSNPNSRGLLQSDLFALARRLSLIGLDPDTKVVVLGKGDQGTGEEGRVAWTLKVLGVVDVYTLLHTSYRQMNVTKDVPPPENKPYWKPQIQDGLTVSLKDFREQAGKENSELVILDVRSAAEFSLQNLSQNKHIKALVLNLDWSEFFDEKGLPDKKVEQKLDGLKISKNTKIFILSNHGVRSGAVTYALQFLGYKKVSNFAGGYEQYLVSTPKVLKNK